MTTAVMGREALPSQAEVMAQAGGENFPVASLVLGRSRRHLMAIYGFARLVDDIGDEVGGDRSQLLNRVETELDGIYRGTNPDHPLMFTLADTIRACDLPAAPFKRLIEANRQDQVVTRYETFEQLLGYCRLSAMPVGELVLLVFGAGTPGRVALSNKICAALQIVEHLQDVSEDYAHGRVYLPAEDLARFDCEETQLQAPLRHASARALIAYEAERASAMLTEGAPLAATLKLPQRLAVAGFVAGGRAALEGVLRNRRPNRISIAAHLPKTAMGR